MLPHNSIYHRTDPHSQPRIPATTCYQTTNFSGPEVVSRPKVGVLLLRPDCLSCYRTTIYSFCSINRLRRKNNRITSAVANYTQQHTTTRSKRDLVFESLRRHQSPAPEMTEKRRPGLLPAPTPRFFVSVHSKGTLSPLFL